MTKYKLLDQAVGELEQLAALVHYQTGDRDLALAILDCSEQLARLNKLTGENE
jgi:hypothetical protein